MYEFKQKNLDGSPAITCYEDAFHYLVRNKSNHSPTTAMALHVFHLYLRDGIRRREQDNLKLMTRDEIDLYIREVIGVNDLEKWESYADSLVLNAAVVNKAKKYYKKNISTCSSVGGILGQCPYIFCKIRNRNDSVYW